MIKTRAILTQSITNKHFQIISLNITLFSQHFCSGEKMNVRVMDQNF